MSKKYELVESSKIISRNVILYRIKALVDIPNIVKAGELGGYIESEKNLSHEGNCWVGDDAYIYENAKVYGNATVYGNAQVYGDAYIYENAQVFGNAKVYGDAQVSGNAKVYGDARVYGDAHVYDDAKVYGYAYVYGNAEVYGDAYVIDLEDHVIQMRTLSKAFALAGLRVGIVISTEKTIQKLNSIAHPYPLNTLTLQIAKSLFDDTDRVQSLINRQRNLSIQLRDIFEEHVSGYDTYVSKVAQKELITVLTRMFKAQI